MLWQFFSHGIQTLIYIVYVSVVGLAVERIVSAPLPAELGGTNPFAHVLMMGGVAIAALMLLRHIRTDVSGRRGGGGLLRQASSVAVGMGMTAALGGAGSAAAQGIRGLRRRSGLQGESTPWERMDAERKHCAWCATDGVRSGTGVGRYGGDAMRSGRKTVVVALKVSPVAVAIEARRRLNPVRLANTRCRVRHPPWCRRAMRTVAALIPLGVGNSQQRNVSAELNDACTDVGR